MKKLALFLSVALLPVTSSFAAEIVESSEAISPRKVRVNRARWDVIIAEQEKVASTIDDLEKTLVGVQRLVAKGKTKTSESIRNFTEHMLQVMPQLTELQKKYHDDLMGMKFSEAKFSPYLDTITLLNNQQGEALQLRGELAQNRSSPEKIEALDLVALLMHSLGEELCTANDFYNEHLIKSLLLKKDPQRSRLNLSDTDYYAEYREKWRSNKEPAERALAISKLLSGVENFNEFMTRFVYEPFDNYMPLLSLAESGAPADFLRQGWKIHVGAKPGNAHKVAEIALPILARIGVAHKILGSMEIIGKLQSDQTQKGKFITVYPLNDDQALNIAKVLDQALTQAGFTPSDFDTPPHDALFGKAGGVFTRYGAYSGMRLLVVDQQGNPLMQEGGFMTIEDARDAGYKPPFVTWDSPFGELLREPTVKKSISPERQLKRKDAQKFDVATPSTSELVPVVDEMPKQSPGKSRHVRGETVEEKQDLQEFIRFMNEMKKKYPKLRVR